MHLIGKKIFVGGGEGLKGRNREHPNPTLYPSRPNMVMDFLGEGEAAVGGRCCGVGVGGRRYRDIERYTYRFIFRKEKKKLGKVRY